MRTRPLLGLAAALLLLTPASTATAATPTDSTTEPGAAATTCAVGPTSADDLRTPEGFDSFVASLRDALFGGDCNPAEDTTPAEGDAPAEDTAPVEGDADTPTDSPTTLPPSDEPPGAAADTPATAAAPEFTYPEPALTDPLDIVLGGETGTADIPADRDAVVRTEPGTPVTRERGIEITGGRNVVIDAEVHHETDHAPGAKGGNGNRALYYKGNGDGGPGDREVFVRRLVASGVVKEGVNIALGGETGVTFTVDYFDASGATFPGTYDAHHSDVVQSWGGPRELRLNRVYAPTTGYQGVLLQPDQFGEKEPSTVVMDNVFIGGNEKSAYLMWMSDQVDKVQVGKNEPGSVAVASERHGTDESKVLWGDQGQGAGSNLAAVDVVPPEQAPSATEVLGAEPAPLSGPQDVGADDGTTGASAGASTGAGVEPTDSPTRRPAEPGTEPTEDPTATEERATREPRTRTRTQPSAGSGEETSSADSSSGGSGEETETSSEGQGSD